MKGGGDTFRDPDSSSWRTTPDLEVCRFGSGIIQIPHD